MGEFFLLHPTIGKPSEESFGYFCDNVGQSTAVYNNLVLNYAR